MALATPMITFAAILILNLPIKITDNVGYKPIQRANEIQLKIETDRLAKIKAEAEAKEAAHIAAVQAAEAARIASQPKPIMHTAPIQTAVIGGCGANFYANYIYMHESGCSLYNPNPSSGACGLGQAWPCSKLRAVCPNMGYACQDAFFTNYANGLGGWQAAYNFWVAHSWW